MPDGSSLGVTPSSGATSQVGLVYNSVFPALSKAGFIGGLAENATGIHVLSQLTSNVNKAFYTFNFEKGDAIKLAFNAVAGPLGDSQGNPVGTNVDGTTEGLRLRLYDITGNVIADSAGNDTQKAAYAALTSSSGFGVSTGGYYVQVSTQSGVTVTDPRAFNIQLYSGTTYATDLVSTAQTQAYDPNLFVSASASLTPPSDLKLYTNTAAMTGDSARALAIGKLDANESELTVVSQLNNLNRSAYYNFDFNSGSALKLSFGNSTLPALVQPLRLQVFDSSGTKVLADNFGTDAQKEAYTKLTSGVGLSAIKGHYLVKVSFAPGALTNTPQSYNFQINSGTTYTTVYKTTAQVSATATTVAPPNVGVFGDIDAQLFTRQQFHTIGETAAKALNIGWVQKDKSRLDVLSQLTPSDRAGYYAFTLQQGDQLKLAFANSTNTAKVRVRLMDASGTQVIADNYGTAAQKKAYAALNSADGLKAKPGQFVVKVDYADPSQASKAQTYNFQIYSGTRFANSYRTTASAEDLRHALASGNANAFGYSSAGVAANYLTNFSQGGDVDPVTGWPTLNNGIISTLSKSV